MVRIYSKSQETYTLQHWLSTQFFEFIAQVECPTGHVRLVLAEKFFSPIDSDITDLEFTVISVLCDPSLEPDVCEPTVKSNAVNFEPSEQFSHFDSHLNQLYLSSTGIYTVWLRVVSALSGNLPYPGHEAYRSS